MKHAVNDVVNYAVNGNVVDLQKSFDSVMRNKINDAIETRKQELGMSIGATEED